MAKMHEFLSNVVQIELKSGARIIIQRTTPCTAAEALEIAAIVGALQAAFREEIKPDAAP